jgi:hypothetical protein
VIVDTDADDEIDSGDVVGMATGQVIPTAIVIWSPGPDGEFDSTPKDSKNKDNVYSIETNWDKNNGHVLP